MPIPVQYHWCSTVYKKWHVDAREQADLEAKYQVTFQSYSADLEAVQALYEKYKTAPPLPRNTPRVAGSIMWARQLLRRIEVPIRRQLSPRPSISNTIYHFSMYFQYRSLARSSLVLMIIVTSDYSNYILL